MKDETVSRVYATALLELAVEKKEVERVHGEIDFLASLPRASALTRAFFESPRIVRSEKAKVIETVLRGKLSDLVVNFMLLLIRKGRALELRDILEEFLIIHDRRIGIVHASAVSAVPLSDPSASALKEALEAKIQKRVEIHNKVEPEILGGLVVRYDGYVADGSLKTALNKIAVRMKAVKLGSQFVHES
jgi:F-type H+-transporting ATPase subunit delta